MTESIGFIGVGVLARAMIGALRERWPLLRIELSPRSEHFTRRLAASDSLVTRHLSNGEVVANAKYVLLSMSPSQLPNALEGISFRDDQIVMTCVSGATIADVRKLCSPAHVVRLLPTPAIARGDGPLLICPPNKHAREIFDGLGDVIEVADEQMLHALWSGSITMSTFFRLQAEVAGYIERAGAPQDIASLYIVSLWRALSNTAYLNHFAGKEDLILGHETPKGLNNRVRTELELKGWFGDVSASLRSNMALKSRDLK